MKTKPTKSALEDTRNREVMGGLAMAGRKSLSAFFMALEKAGKGVKMGYLLDINWDEGRGLEDLVIWGIVRILKFLDLFDEGYGRNDKGPEDEYAEFLYYEMKDILSDMETVINRFMDELNKKESQKLDEKETPEPDSSHKEDSGASDRDNPEDD